MFWLISDILGRHSLHSAADCDLVVLPEATVHYDHCSFAQHHNNQHCIVLFRHQLNTELYSTAHIFDRHTRDLFYTVSLGKH